MGSMVRSGVISDEWLWAVVEPVLPSGQVCAGSVRETRPPPDVVGGDLLAFAYRDAVVRSAGRDRCLAIGLGEASALVGGQDLREMVGGVTNVSFLLAFCTAR